MPNCTNMLSIKMFNIVMISSYICILAVLLWIVYHRIRLTTLYSTQQGKEGQLGSVKNKAFVKLPFNIHIESCVFSVHQKETITNKKINEINKTKQNKTNKNMQ